MKSEIMIRIRNMTLLLAMAGALVPAHVARAQGWTLSTSDFTTDPGGTAMGDDDAVSWHQYATDNEAHSVDNNELSVSTSGEEAYDSVSTDSTESGSDGKDVTCNFGATATATWTSSGGGDALIITASTDLSGTIYVDGTLTLDYGDGGSGWTSSDAGGSATLLVQGIATNLNFVNVTNWTSPTFTSNNAAFSDPTFDYDTAESGGLITTYSWADTDYSITWTNTYLSATGLSSLSAGVSVYGVAVADLQYEDAPYADGSSEAEITMTGSATVSFKLNLN